MSLIRTALVAALASALLLSGCSGDDGKSADSSDSTPTSEQSTGKDKTNTKEARDECTAEVKTTGAVKKSWKGEAFAITENQSGPVIYRTSKGKATLTVLGAEGDFDAVGRLTVGKRSYTADSGVEADDEGAGAEVDADGRGSDSKDSVHITATITC